ncbi:MAG: hypothetical protein ACTTKZ_06525, partial [Bacteroides sp.]
MSARHVVRRRNIFLLVGLFCLVFFVGSLRAEGWRYWFDIPEVNRYHVGVQDIHVYLHLSTSSSKNVSVKLSLPAEPNFTPQIFNIPANGKIKVDLTWHGSGAPPVANPMEPGPFAVDWFYQPFKNGALETATSPAVREKYIENVLDWSESDMNHPTRPYLNRTKKGVYMESVVTPYTGISWAPAFSAYIEVANLWNREMIVLKSAIAESMYMITPMQSDLTLSHSQYNTRACPSYRSYNITATKDDTKLLIWPTHDIWVNTNQIEPSSGVRGYPLQGGRKYTIWLNKGESTILTPYSKRDPNIPAAYPTAGSIYSYQTGREPGENLAGTVIQSLRESGTSGGSFVVTYQEGLLRGGNPDMIADQLVQQNNLSTHYGVVRGIWNANMDKEYLYIVAPHTSGGANVRINGAAPVHIGPRQQYVVKMSGSASYALESDNVVMVFHMSGADQYYPGYGYRGQRAGAQVPPLSNQHLCVGSKEVDFSRAQKAAHGYTLYLNILAFMHPDDPDQCTIGNFKLKKTQWSTTGTPPVTQVQFVNATSPGEVALLNHINDINNWHTFTCSPGSPLENWRWIQVDVDGFPGFGNDNIIKVDDGNGHDMGYRLICENNVFHLALLNGRGGSDALYGYFSDFNRITTGIKVKENGVELQGGAIPICRGQSVELDAQNGNFKHAKYTWTPPLYLDDPKKPKVKVINPKKSMTYEVTMGRFCDFDKREDKKARIRVEVHPNITPTISGPSVLCGAGEVPVDLGDLDGATKLNM